ncbi:MAG: AsmA family protein [Gammaproteobacteria bacterium]|nr:AsmA family protein [Gammaproteobacteria bacterium]
MRAAKRVAISFVAILAVVTVLAGAVAVALARIDPEDLNHFLSESARELTGRNLSFRGKTELTLLPSPTLVFENAAFDNAGWSKTPDMMRVKRAEAGLAWLPLLHGEFRITRLLLVKPEVHLETARDGTRNWHFGGGQGDGDAEPAPEGSRRSAALPPGLALGVSRVHIVGGRISYRDARSGRSWRITVDEITASGDVADAPLTLHGRAAFDGRPFEIAAKVGELGALLRNEPYDVQVALLGAGAAFRADGVIERPLEGAGWWMNVSYEIPSLAALAGFFSAELPWALPVNGTAKLTDVRGQLRLDKIDAKVALADGSIVARGSLGDLLHFSGAELALEVSTRSLVSLAGLARVRLPAGGPVRATATLRDVDGRLRLADVAAELRLDGRSANTRLAVTGSIADLERLRGVDLHGKLLADSLARLSDYAGARLPDIGPLEAKGRLLRDKRAWRIVDAHAVVGKSDATGRLTLHAGTGRPRLTGRIDAGLLDLDEITGHRPAPPGARLFSAERWPLAVLGRVDLDVDLRAGRIRVHALALERARVKVRLADGRLDLAPTARLAGGDFSGNIRLDASARGARIVTRLDGRGFDLGVLSAQLGRKRLLEGGRSELSIEASGRGDSMRELMAGLNGELRLVTSKARIRKEDLREAGGDLASHVLGGSDEREPATTLHCAVVRVSIKDGLASADRTIALETDQALVSATGTVDLASERVDAGVHVATRGGIRISGASLSNMVRVGGTLAEPSVRANAVGIAGAAATVAGAVVTGGLSLLAQGVLGQVLSDSSPCKTALESGTGGGRGVVPAGSGKFMHRPAESGS